MKEICLISQTGSNRSIWTFTVPFLNITNSLQLSHLNFFYFRLTIEKNVKRRENLSDMTFFCYKTEMISHTYTQKNIHCDKVFLFFRSTAKIFHIASEICDEIIHYTFLCGWLGDFFSDNAMEGSISSFLQFISSSISDFNHFQSRQIFHFVFFFFFMPLLCLHKNNNEVLSGKERIKCANQSFMKKLLMYIPSTLVAFLIQISSFIPLRHL